MVYLRLFLVILMFSTHYSFGQDTTFVRSLPLPIYVNNITTDGSQLYIRSKDSIYTWVNDQLKYETAGELKYSWVTKQKSKTILTHSKWVSKSRRPNRLKIERFLPVSTWNQNTTMATLGSHLFICSNGIIFEYQVRDYVKLTLRGSSIRHIYSEPFFRVVSSYDGIFIDTIWSNYGEIVEDNLAKYSNGTFKRIDQEYLLCQDNLLSFDRSTYKFKTRIITEGQPRFRDIFKFSGRILGLMTKGLCQVDLSRNEINEYILSNETISGYVIVGDHLYLSTQGGKVFKLDDQLNIEQSTFIQKANNIVAFKDNLILCTNDGLYQTDLNLMKIEKVAEGLEIHTAIVFNDKLIFSGNYGLNWFDGQDSESIISNVEFNKMALSIDDHSLYSGSVKGLYVIEVPVLDVITSKRNTSLSKPEVQYGIDFWLPAITIFLVLIAISVYLYFAFFVADKDSSSKKISISTSNIEKIMLEDPKLLSVKDVANYYDTSVSQISRKLLNEGETPLHLIKEIKRKIAIQMVKEEKSLEEIAKRVGYSKRYVRENFLK